MIQWLSEHDSLIISFVSLAVSVTVSWYLSTKAENAMNWTKKLVSTRSPGDFPDYLPEVEKLIRGAKHSLRIMALLPSHGDYSEPKMWNRIQAALLENAQTMSEPRFNAILLYCDRECALQAFRTHHNTLKDPNRWREWRDAEQARLQAFWKSQGLTKSIKEDLAELSLERYLDMRVSAGLAAASKIYSAFQRVESTERLPMFCWIADAPDHEGQKSDTQKAVFSIRAEDLTGHYHGPGFVTEDPTIVKALKTTFDYYLNYPKGTEM
jgi:hypothetical protein